MAGKERKKDNKYANCNNTDLILDLAPQIVVDHQQFINLMLVVMSI